MKNAPLHKPVTKVVYQFSDAGVPARLLEGHARDVKITLGFMFGVRMHNVLISSKPSVSKEHNFSLSCYVSDSETSPPALALAAKAVLPLLRNLHSMAKEWRTWFDTWTPGENADVDTKALYNIAAGYACRLTAEQQQWLERIAYLFLIDTEQEGWTPESIAQEVLERTVMFDLEPVYPGQGEPAQELLVNEHDEY